MRAAKARFFLVFLFLCMVLPAMADDYYWIGGSGNWTDPDHWSDKPNGKSIGATPGFEDDVYFTAESFDAPNQKVIVNTIAVCRSMTWKNITNNPLFLVDDDIDHDLTIYGSLRLDPGMTFEFNNPIYFRSSTAGNEIDMQGQSFRGDIYFQNNGTWNVVGDMDISGKTLYFEQGNLQFDGEVRCLEFVSNTSTSRSLTLNNSHLILLGGNRSSWQVNSNNLVLNAGVSKISIQAENSEFVTSGSNPLNFYDLEFAGNHGTLRSAAAIHSFHGVKFLGSGSIYGSHKYGELDFSMGGSYALEKGEEQDVNGTFTARGDCSNFVTIEGDGGISFIQAKAVDLTNLKVRNVTAKGVLFDAVESFDLGNNTGWNFTEPVAVSPVWTGAAGDGKWSTPGNWSTVCVPTRIDNVTITGATVSVDTYAECKDLTLTGGAGVNGTSGINIFGSLAADGAGWDISGETHFSAVEPGTYTINMGTNAFKGDLVFDGIRTWEMQSDLKANGFNITLVSGLLDTKDKEMRCNQFKSTGDATRSIVLGASKVFMEGDGPRTWELSGKGFSLDPGSSTIQLSKEGAGMYNNLPTTPHYNIVVFSSPTGQAQLVNEGAVINFDGEVNFSAGANIRGNNSYKHLILAPGKEYLFEAGMVQTIVATLTAVGDCSKYITLKGDGGVAEIFSDVNITIDRVKLENMKAGRSGGPEHIALGAIDLGGNIDWDMKEPASQDLYWSGDAGDSDWFNSKNWVPNCVPTRVDNVFFDAGTFTSPVKTVLVKGDGPKAECLSMNWNNAPALAVFDGAGEMKIFGSLDLDGLINLNYTGKIFFKSPNAEEIRLGGNILSGDLHFEGKENDDTTWDAGSWTLKDQFQSTADVILERGSLITDNNNVEVKGINSNFSTTRSLTLGSSVVKLHSIELSPGNFAFDAGTSQLNFDANGRIVASPGTDPLSFYNARFEESSGLAQLNLYAENVSFNNIEFTCNANLQYGGVVAESLVLAMGKTYRFQEDKTFDLGNLIAIGGCDGFIDLSTFTSGVHTIFNSKNGSDITIEGVNLIDIHAQGATFTANNSIDLGNNEGWNIKDKGKGIDLYWIGGTGDWDDKSHWASAANPAGGACLPTAFDNVHFDLNSFSGRDQTVYVGSNDIRCKTMDWTGATGSPNFVSKDGQISGIYIYGSLIFIEDMNVDLPDDLNFYFRATEAGQEIQSGNYEFTNDVKFEGLGGEWSLKDNLTVQGNIILDNGALLSNGKNIECLVFKSENTSSKEMRILDIRNSQFTLNGYNDQAMKVTTYDEEYDKTFELKAEGSTVVVDNSGAISFGGVSEYTFNIVEFKADGKIAADRLKLHYNNLVFRGNGTILGENSFKTLELSRGNTYVFEERKLYVIESELIADGSCNFPITIESNRADSKAIFSKTSGDVKLDYIILKDIHAKNTGVKYIATNSINNGNTDGWTITDRDPQKLYWVGNGATDDWDDYENWSTESGGTAEGCVPTSIDDVIFDRNSFFGSKKVIISNNSFCHDMTWEADIDPGAIFNVNQNLEISGALTFAEKMSLNYNASMLFTGDGDSTEKIVNLADKSLDGDIVFEGKDQTWKLASSLITSADLLLKKGFLDTQDNDLEVSRFESEDYDTMDLRKLELGNSKVKISSSANNAWNMVMLNAKGDMNMEFHSDLSMIEFLNGGRMFCWNDGEIMKFNDLIFHDNGVLEMKGGTGEFNIVSFKEKSDIKGSNSYQSLELTIGHHNTIEAGETQTILIQLIMEGVSCEPVELKSSEPGNAAFISKNSGEINIYHARLKDIHATGGAKFWVIGSFEDEGNNAEWYEKVLGAGEDGTAPSWGFDNPIKEEFCSSVAVIDEVLEFPINKHTTFQWYRDKEDGAGYQPIPGETNAVIKVSESGKYQVEVIYNATCKPVAEIEITIDGKTKMTLEVSGKNLVCHNDGTGQVSVTVTNGYPDYVYTWTNADGQKVGEDEATLYGLEPGKYYVTVLDSKSCQKSAETEIFNAYALNIDKVEKIDVSCFGEAQGTIAITASGGNGAIRYFLNDVEQTGSTIDALLADTYKIYVQDDNDCKTEAPDEIITQPDEILFDWLASGLNCNGDGNGQIDPRVSGGVAPYSYQWSGPSSFDSKDSKITGLSGGDYTLTVKDRNNCVVTKPYKLIEPDPLLINARMTKEVDCFGNKTGEIFVEADQGRLPYTFKVGDISNKDGVFKGLPAGDYDIEVIDNGGCNQFEKVAVTQPNQLELMVDAAIEPGCIGERNGEIKVTAMQGKIGYSYSWIGPNDYRSEEEDIDGLEAGLYQLKLRDRNDCELITDIDLQKKPELQLGLRVKEHVSAAGAEDGELIVEMVGGQPDYSFSCTGSNGFSFNSPANLKENIFKIENLEGGIYTVNLSDASGCNTISGKVMIEEPGKLMAFISSVKNISCTGANDGQLKVSMSGSDDYAISWSGPEGFTSSQSKIDALIPGNYTVSVSSKGSTVKDNSEIIEPAALEAKVIATENLTCNGNPSGVLELDISGGSSSYNVSWEGPNGFLSRATKLIQLEAGGYAYTVKDANNCEVKGNASVVQPDALKVDVTTVNISSAGLKDGSLSVSVSGGVPNYTYYITGPNNYSKVLQDDDSGFFVVNNLGHGLYRVEVVDANDCNWVQEFSVLEPGKMLAYVADITHLKCYGVNNGAINLTVENGSGDYTFRWTGPDYYTSQLEDPVGLKAGLYEVEVIDNPTNEKQKVKVELTQPEKVQAEYVVKDISCNGNADGYINIFPQGGISGYTYNWVGKVSDPSEEDQKGLTAGTYEVVLTDANGCKSDAISIEVREPQPLAIGFSSMEPSCYGFDNGSINLNPENGTAPYRFSWNESGSIQQELNELKIGDYQFSVVDKNGCFEKGQVHLSQPDTLIAEINDFSNIPCYGEGFGRALVSVTGGTTDYRFKWSDGQTDQEPTNLKKGDYKVVVTDAHDCIDSARVRIDEPDPLLLLVKTVQPTTHGSEDGRISLYVEGGTPNYIYEWEPINEIMDQVTHLNAGEYHAVVTDHNLCQVDTLISLKNLFEERVAIPKAFTPNSDGHNDRWEIERVHFVKRLQISVYDRWGKVIYKFDGSGDEYKGNPWDGREGNQLLPLGSYYFAIQLDDDKPILGSVAIVR
ncbi:MAG: T9SS type B sorting domain-containing protein [Marinifilaceae bacterium]